MNGLKQLAIEAGFPVSSKYDGIGYVWCSDEYPIDEQLQKFATLVAAAEREACAKLCDVRAQGYSTCKWSDGYKQGGAASAAAIRARGNDAA